MSKNINSKLHSLANAPTPQNTPASVTSSYLKSNPLKTTLPSTISENDEDGLADLKSKLTSNPQFLSLIEGKLGTLVGEKSGYVAGLPTAVKNRIFSLKTVQGELNLIEREFQDELAELEKRFAGKYAVLHDKRAAVIRGDVEPTEEEVAKGKQIERELGEADDEDEEEEEEEEEEGEGEDEDEEKVKGIPAFWLTALQNLQPIAELINDRDEEVLTYLEDIQLRYVDKPGFQLVFKFAENPFFKNTEITKTYYYQNELGYSGDFIYDHAEGSEIEWVSSKQNVTVSIERRKQRNKATQQTRTIEKLTPVESFFNFFDPPKMPNLEDAEDAEEEDEEDEDEEGFLEQRLAFDYQVGEEIKDKLIPRAIDWFTGAAIEYEEDDDYPEGEEGEEYPEGLDEEEEEEESDESDEDEDGDEDGDAEKDETKQPPECKQS
jgi:nucleosome assembly protein 1-like 1